MPSLKKNTSNTPWIKYKAANDLRDAIVSVALGQSTLRNVVITFKVRGGDLKCAAEDIAEYELNNNCELQCSDKYRGLYRWASEHTGAKCKEGSAYTEHELHQLVYKFIIGDGKNYKVLFKKYGVPKRSFTRYSKKILYLTGTRDLQQLRSQLDRSQITKKKLKDIILQTPKPVKGRPTLLTKDEEALVVATAEIKGAHSLPTTRKTLVLKLNEVLVGVSGRDT